MRSPRIWKPSRIARTSSLTGLGVRRSYLKGLMRTAALACLVLALPAPSALAYWSNAGEGSASASLATLAAPSISAATPGAEAVELTWSAVTPPAGGTVQYFVTRDGGAPSGGCPGSSSPSTATSCTDTGVSIGPHEYTVTAVWRSWTASSSTASATVSWGVPTHLVLEAAGTTPAAGESDSLTIAAKDASNRTVGSYSGPHNVIFEGATESATETKPVVVDSAGVEQPFTDPTELTFSEGRAVVSGGRNGVMKLYKAETAHIRVSEGALNSGAGLAITVKAGAFGSFRAVPVPGEPEAGVSFEVKLTAWDEWHNTITSYTRTSKLHYEGAEAAPSGKAAEYSTTTEPTFSGGEATVKAFKFFKAASTTLKVKEEGSGHEGAGTFTVKAGTAKKLSLPTLGEPEAGVAFNVTVTALDEWSNTAKTYTGSKALTWSGPGNAPNGTAPEYPAGATAVAFTEGVGTATGVTLYYAQSITLKAKGTIEGTSATFTVKAAAATAFTTSAMTEREAGVAFNLTVTAWDPWHNTAKSYTGTRSLVFSEPSNAPGGQAPSYPETVTFTAGAGTASIKLYDAQTTTLTVEEGALEATTGSFTVKAATAKKFSLPTPAEQEAGAAFSVTVTALDEWGNTAKTYTGSKALTWSNPASSPSAKAPEYPTTATTVTFTTGVGVASAIKLFDAQSTTLKVKQSTIEGTTPGVFTVKPTTASRLAFSRPEVSSGKLDAGTCPFACVTSSIGHNGKFKAVASVTDQYGNIVSNLGSTSSVKVEKTSGEGTLANAAAVTIPASGLAEAPTVFEYTSPAATSEAVLKLKVESGATYTEAEAQVKY
jgi:hypothetical protein